MLLKIRANPDSKPKNLSSVKILKSDNILKKQILILPLLQSAEEIQNDTFFKVQIF